jgi:hypothetical protein
MKKILSLAVLILLIWNQPSFAESNWFKQKSPQAQPEQPVESKPDTVLPKGVAPNGQSPALLLKQPCGRADKMFETLKRYKELLLFTGEGLTFSTNGQPYNGAMMFFINQETGSWTALQVYSDGMACMIFNGKKFEPYTGKQPNYGESK